MGLGYRVSLCHLAGEMHAPHLVSVSVLQTVRVCRRPVDRLEVGLNDLLRQLPVRHNIPDVPLHGLPGVQDSGFLVLPGVGCLQQMLRLGPHLRFPALVPQPQQAGDPLVFPLRLIDLRDPPDIVPLRVQVPRLDLTPQQPPHLRLVAVCQKVPGLRLFISPPGFLQVRPQRVYLLQRGGRLVGRLRRLSGSIRVPLHIPQFSQEVGHGRLKIVLGILPEVRRPVSVIFIQRLLHNPEGLGHLRDPLQLVRDIVLPILVEELRPPGGQLLVNLVHVGFPALCGDVQPPEVALPEVVEIRDTCCVLLGDLQLRVPQVVPQLLVLVVVFPGRHHALFVCLVEQVIHCFSGHSSLHQVRFGDIAYNGGKELPPRPPGNAQAVAHLSQQLPLHAL